MLVYAEAQVAHLDIFKKLKIKNILFGLNFYLSKEKFGEDISIKKLIKLMLILTQDLAPKKKLINIRFIIMNLEALACI